MREARIVRRLRVYENERGPESVRGLRDDAASEIVTLRATVVATTVFWSILLIWVARAHGY
jgi:hypothetical protein